MSNTVLQKNVNIPVHITDLSTFDDSFSYMKARFRAEMSRVSEEMNKFSSDLMRLYASTSSTNPAISAQPNASVIEQQNISVTSQIPALTAQQASVTSPQNAGASQEKNSELDQANWAAITESPLIIEEGDSKKLKLQFDVSHFDPAEVKVQILNDILYVKAKHDERTDNSLVLREYSQQFMLPKGIDPESVVSSLSRDGVLTVEAPLPQMVLELGKELEKMYMVTEEEKVTQNTKAPKEGKATKERKSPRKTTKDEAKTPGK